jgi:hypothetical protein
MVDVDRGRRPDRGQEDARPRCRDERSGNGGGDQRVLQRVCVELDARGH